jgi:curved DNA-binding protein CbpA
VLELITHGSKLQLLCTYLNKKTHGKKKKKTPLAHTGSKMDHLTNDRRRRRRRRSRSSCKSSNSTSSKNSCLCRASRSFKAESTDEAVKLPSPGKWWPQLLLDKKTFLLVRIFVFLLFLLLLLVASCRCED